MSAPPEPWTAPLFAPAGGLPRDEQIKRFLPVYFSRGFIAENEALLVDLQLRGTAVMAPSTPARQGAANRAFDTYDRLPSLQMPTLILHGDQDAITPVENAAILARLIPHAVVEIVAGTGHVITTEQPQGVAERVLAFLR
jgi:pimeloyl-ACP methyl ester carboxylesterase